MRRRVLALAVSTLLLLGVAYAQDDPFPRMVGTWQGKLEVRDDPDKTLVIRSVVRERDVWVANVEYGSTGKSLQTLPARMERQRGTPTLTFPTSATSKVELELVSERELRGLLKVSDGSGSWVARKLSLKKTSDKP
jgi:hypothetical protein